ncbi:PAS domain S-box protein [Vibrio sp. YMD68]|uniref:PAS domain-containing protein n=1 Tax=Vibrio sp. YMD68 TaxID=3042300 RepID=UPI00249B63AF|nr:PAS domain-containing protein [Vibrio sp. YMD68]WGV98536.1 PAS domain S-box protein [Vibrio sp. YMD68]
MNNEIFVSNDEVIVSKTDTQGRIVYANRVFMQISNYTEEKLLGQHHNIIRHSDMPRGVFHGLWHTLKAGNEFFGFVKNSTSDGNYYWVFANITPDYNSGELAGYYSVRRKAPNEAIELIQSIYTKMKGIEQTEDKKNGPALSWKTMVDDILSETNMTYSEYVISLYNKSR